jgi:DNA polymerase-3 subunit gamma/tau
MLENIVGHTALVATLRDELASERFPRAVLFSGPPYGGKLSTALETARVLTCREGTAAWSCDCVSCRSQKELTHPHTVLLGSRYADVEIAACADALMRSRRPAALYLFFRAVRKLTRRFDAAILDQDDPRMKGAPEKVAGIEELLADVAIGTDLPTERALGAWTEKVASAAAPLAAQLRGDGITVGQVRVLSSWAHLTASGSRKIAIIENADRMQDSARNALLKLLEEPPAAVHLILLATRRGAILPTILSRLRPYSFQQRTKEEEREVMGKIFRMEQPGADTLRGFFLGWKSVNPEVLAGLSERFLRLVGETGSSRDIIAELPEIFPARGAAAARVPRESALYFLEELAGRMRAMVRDGTPVEVLEEWREALREAQARIEVLNLAPAAVVESLYYRLRAAAQGSAAPVPMGDA